MKYEIFIYFIFIYLYIHIIIILNARYLSKNTYLKWPQEIASVLEFRANGKYFVNQIFSTDYIRST